MIRFFLAGDNIPFMVSLVIMLGIAFIEGAGVLLGLEIFGFLDGDADIDAGSDMPDGAVNHSLFSSVLGWIKVGNVPLFAVMSMFFTFFGIVGLLVQMIVQSLFTHLLPWYIAIWPVLLVTIPLVRQGSSLLARFVFKDETMAVSEDSFVGKLATITLGVARKGTPAQAKVYDRFGQAHYVMVEPDGQEQLSGNHEVLLIHREGAVFRAVNAPETINKNIS